MKILAIIVVVIIYLVVIIFTWKDGYKNGKHDGAVDEQIKSREKVRKAYEEGKDIGEKQTLKHISPPYLYELSKKMKRISVATALSDVDIMDIHTSAEKTIAVRDELIAKIIPYINYEAVRTYDNKTSLTVWIRILAEKEPSKDKGQQR